MKNLFSLYLIWLLMYLYVNLNYLFYSLYFIRGFPLWSSGWDSTLAMQVAWVQSLVRELISYMLCNAAKRFFFFFKRASLVAQLVENPLAMWETWVQSLGCEDTLEKRKATHSSILAWRISWIVQTMGCQRVGQNWATFTLH